MYGEPVRKYLILIAADDGLAVPVAPSLVARIETNPDMGEAIRVIRTVLFPLTIPAQELFAVAASDVAGMMGPHLTAWIAANIAAHEAHRGEGGDDGDGHPGAAPDR